VIGNFRRSRASRVFMLAILFAVQLTVADLSSELAQRAKDAGLPAVQAAVINHEGLVAHGAAGVTVLNGSAAVATGDAFHIGSCTKPFTATLAGMLIEEKKLAWETRIADVFPEWTPAMRPEYRDVTLADLLSHEAGLPAYGEEEEAKALPPFTGNATDKRRAFARYVLEHPPAIAPRTAFQYSNAGYTVAAAMIERAAGRSWEELVRKQIFEPLHMRTAGIGWPERVWGHENGKPVDPHGPYQLPAFLTPAGDLHMSSDDLALFLQAHLRAMRGTPTIITAQTAAAMHTRRKKSGLGFGVASVAGFENVATHSGSADTFVTVIAIAAKEDVAVARLHECRGRARAESGRADPAGAVDALRCALMRSIDDRIHRTMNALHWSACTSWLLSRGAP
jgi:CubicO group peptidase (beta-lactamase class C family)